MAAAEIKTLLEKEKLEKVPYKRKQVRLAVSALYAHLSQSTKTKNDELFESDQPIWLLISLHKIPAPQKAPHKIPLPHKTKPTNEVCLITKDPSKVVKATFQEKSVDCVQKVISLTKLRKNYKTFELKRQLMSSFDTFICDDRIYPMVCKAMGKEAYKRKREPLPVKLSYPDVKGEIEKTLGCTTLRLGKGANINVRIGDLRTNSEAELLANTLHAIKVIATKVPNGWNNIKCLYVKSSTSVALPLYQSALKLDEAEKTDDTPPKTKKAKKV